VIQWLYRAHELWWIATACRSGSQRLTCRHGQLCLGHVDRRQALHLRCTAARLRGLTATHAAKNLAFMPSMTRPVRHCRRDVRAITADCRVRQEAKELAAGCVEGELLGLRLAMGEQRSTVAADEVEDDQLDRPPPKAAVHLQPADDLTAENPDVVAMLAQSLARQMQAQQVAQERLEAVHYLLAGRNVACLIRPTAWPLIEIRTVDLQGIGGSLLRW